MDKKQMYVQVVNLETGKVFSLPTLYTDRTEACVCGQNYIRDRQAEEPCSKLFFRVLFAKDGRIAPEYYLWDDQSEEDNNCDDECKRCDFCCENEDNEEPILESLAEILSAFSAIRPNY